MVQPRSTAKTTQVVDKKAEDFYGNLYPQHAKKKWHISDEKKAEDFEVQP